MNRLLGFDMHSQAFGKIHPVQERITLGKYQPCAAAAQSPKGRLLFVTGGLRGTISILF